MPDPVRSFTRLRTLCEGALELDPDEREPWLERMCEGDAALIAEVRDLLQRVDEGGTLAELFDGRP